MNYVHCDKVSAKFPPINMDYVESLSVDDDGDLKFRLKSGKDFYWEYNDKQKSWEMIEKILTHIESTNMDNQVKFG